MPLTKRQSEILAYLQGHIHENGYAPSFEEIAEKFGFQSLATVHEHLTNLERKGYIRRSYNESRAIEVLPPRGTAMATEIPLLGKVAAGTPIEALMQQETLAVPDAMLPRRGPNYALKVVGSSMIDEHILDGDYVVVHGRQTAENGRNPNWFATLMLLLNSPSAKLYVWPSRSAWSKVWLIQLKPVAICCALTVSASLALAPWPLKAK